MWKLTTCNFIAQTHGSLCFTVNAISNASLKSLEIASIQTIVGSKVARLAVLCSDTACNVIEYGH